MTYASAELVITLPTEAPLQATAATPDRAPVGQAAGDRVQRSNPLPGIVKEFLFEGEVSYVAMATQGMNYELREPQLRGEAHKSIKTSDQSGWQDDRQDLDKTEANLSSLFVKGGWRLSLTSPAILKETWSFQNLEREVQYIKHISQ